MTILGIDTSCDDTSASILRDGRVISNIVWSQTKHADYGGVVPELASRDHVRNILPAMLQALKDGNISLKKIDGIGITYGPGLVGSLLIGISFVKSLSMSLGIPFIGINHIEAHIFSLFIEKDPVFPIIALVVSGGHTELVLVEKYGNYRVFGTTLDDACGEAFDKVAGMLGFPYPGGKEIERLAEKGKKDAIKFPRANPGGYDFSFSGLKTAVLYHIRKNPPGKKDISDIAASFQEACTDSLISTTLILSEDLGIRTIGLCGGVARNKRLREKFRNELEDYKLIIPSYEFCTDNGAMVAKCAEYYLKNGISSNLSLAVSPSLKL